MPPYISTGYETLVSHRASAESHSLECMGKKRRPTEKKKDKKEVSEELPRVSEDKYHNGCFIGPVDIRQML